QLVVATRFLDGSLGIREFDFPSPVSVAALPRAGAAPDLVVGYTLDAGSPGRHVVQVLFNQGSGNFLEGPTYDVPNLVGVLAVADFNGDCIPDVAASAGGCYATGGGVSVLLGNLDGGFGPAQSLSVPVGGNGLLTILGPVAGPRAFASM